MALQEDVKKAANAIKRNTPGVALGDLSDSDLRGSQTVGAKSGAVRTNMPGLGEVSLACSRPMHAPVTLDASLTGFVKLGDCKRQHLQTGTTCQAAAMLCSKTQEHTYSLRGAQL